jgi:shikimate kinase
MVNGAIQKAAENGQNPGSAGARAAATVAALGPRSIVLIGMMGAGKSSVGRRLAVRLGLSFVDADNEIEGAAGMTIAEIFAQHGEDYFRAGEARVIARLLDGGPQVLATGGGAVMNQRTRDLIHIKGISVWLKADLDVLLKRTRRRHERPLADRIKELLPVREPVYAQADIVVKSRDEAHDVIVEEIIAALASHLGVDANSDVKPEASS